MLFGASVHPYRADALQELERCLCGGAVLLKWLPVVQGMDPADKRCIPMYEALAHHRLPLLCHTGGEQSLPNRYKHLADPGLLEEALKRGVTVIMAHCGTHSTPIEHDYLPTFMRLARQYENCYGDTSALNLPTRSYAYDPILADPVVRQKLVHGSDWPIVPVPPMSILGIERSLMLLRDMNWLRRDARIKQELGFDEAYWQRAGKVLRIARSDPIRQIHPATP
jgi:predicted TIM-barrel fold metal-dependent hydrolase